MFKIITYSLAVFALAFSSNNALAQGGPPQGPPPVTSAQPIQREVTDWDDYTGRFEAADVIEVRARVGGYLESVKFKEGATVKKGDLLFVLDQRPYKAALNEAEAQVRAAQTRVTLANGNFNRSQELVKTGAVSKQSFDTQRQQQQEAMAGLEGAKAARDTAKLNLDFTEIRAPGDGKISRKLVTEGNIITGGTAESTLLTTIVSLNPIQFYMSVDEQSYLKYARLGKQGASSDIGAVRVSLMDEKDFPHRGKVDFVDNRLDTGSGTMRVRATFDNPDMFLAPGMFGRAQVLASNPYKAILISDDAVTTDQSRKLVMVVSEDGTVNPQPVTLGPLNNGLRVVKDGLKGDEWIIIKGLQRARPGTKVQAEHGKMPEPTGLIGAAAPTTEQANAAKGEAAK